MHARAHTCSHSHFLSPVCLHYVMERAARLYTDPSNLISHWGRTAYIRSREWSEEGKDEDGDKWMALKTLLERWFSEWNGLRNGWD